MGLMPNTTTVTELNRVRLPDGRLVALTVDNFVHGSGWSWTDVMETTEVNVTGGWLLDADCARVRELTEAELELFVEDEAAYAVVLEDALAEYEGRVALGCAEYGVHA